MELWEAPELGCFALKEIYDWKLPGGAPLGRTEKIATSVQLGDPPSKLYNVSSEYQELAPSSVFALVQQVEGGVVASTSMEKRLRQLDQRYHEGRLKLK